MDLKEEFIKCVYKNIVEDGKNIYRELYENTEITEKTTEYWCNLLNLYGAFNDKQKKVFMSMTEQIIIDTVSSVFGVLDGSSTLSGGEFELEVKINGVCMEGELQDCFLGYIEDNNNELAKTKKNAEYLEKINRADEQIKNGQVVTRTMDEFLEME